MKVIRSKHKLIKYARSQQRAGVSIGFVPTMGCLHAGHLSLMRRARKENDRVVVSIFVNPLQFGPHEDFAAYPRTEKKDLVLCSAAGADAVYLPAVVDFYKEPCLSSIHVRGITEGLCGVARPGHFDGVATVVMKLFQQVRPTRAYFGNKDYQQLVVIKQFVKDLDLSITIIGCPIVREKDGLAMSSRNRYLSEDERMRALVLNKTLLRAAEWIKEGITDVAALRKRMKALINKQADKVDYIEVRRAADLRKISTCRGSVVIAVAAYFGKARLIDNKVITMK
jgi:pantoate--beta-alanine ligase